MTLSKITAVFFSATGRTEKALDIFLSALPLSAEKIDLTVAEPAPRVLGADELLVFAAPVYGGRIPAKAAQRFKRLVGNGAHCVCLAVYGNRDYDDALLEMTDLAQQNGFMVPAAAALVAEHSIMRSVARGRPDGRDVTQIALFAARVWEKLSKPSLAGAERPLSVKGNRPYKPYPAIPLKPAASSACVKCGVCAKNCPAGAITSAAPDQTDPAQCISCLRCVSVCPHGARKLNAVKLFVAEKLFAFKFGARKEPEFYI